MDIPTLSATSGIAKDTLSSRRQRLLEQGLPVTEAALTRPVSPTGNGKVPKEYGGRTIQGWFNYYEMWGHHTPSKRTIRTDFQRGTDRGLTYEQIVAKQKSRWGCMETSLSL